MENDHKITVRASRDSDVDAMLSIYRHHIRHGIEESVDDNGTPEPDDLRDRRKNLRNTRLPHLVAVCDGEVVGYLTSGNYGHHLGSAIGLGYVACRKDGESAAEQLRSSYSIDVAGTIVPAEVSFKPMYDPKAAQVRL